jgi:hypothetical protein
VRFELPAERVLVITALGSLTAEEVKALGFKVIERPVTIGEIVATIGEMLSRTPPEHSAHHDS